MPGTNNEKDRRVKLLWRVHSKSVGLLLLNHCLLLLPLCVGFLSLILV